MTQRRSVDGIRAEAETEPVEEPHDADLHRLERWSTIPSGPQSGESCGHRETRGRAGLPRNATDADVGHAENAGLVASLRLLNWQHLDEPAFNRVVEALLVRHHRDDLSAHVYAVDGRGGDEGLDVVVEVDGVVAHVYQLKFFPEGFSGGFSKSRRPQIKSSFQTALSQHSPDDWTLVVPGNGTLPERKYVGALRGQQRTRVHFMGRAELDNLLASYPEIAAWATRDPLVDTLRLLREEQAELAGPRDLGDRIAGLAAKEKERSPYWGVRFASDERGVTQTLYPKRPDAAEKEPLQLELTAQFGPDHGDLRKQFFSMLEWGSSTAVRLPPQVAVKLVQTGPEWFADEHAEVHLEMWSMPVGGTRKVELRVLSDTNAVLASLWGQATVSGRGSRGGTLHTSFRHCLTIDWRIPDGTGAGGAEFSFSMGAAESAADALAVMRLLRVLRPGCSVEVLVDGHSAFLCNLTGAIEDWTDDVTDSLVDDLAFLERELSLSVKVPEEVTVEERLMVRIARMVLEGRCAIWPFTDTLAGELNGTLDDGVRMTMSGPFAFSMTAEGFTINFSGSSYEIGDVQLVHPHTEIPRASEHLAALERGDGAGRRVEFRAGDETPFRIFSPARWAERWQDSDRLLRPEPWGLPGVDEHPRLSAISGTQGLER